MNQILSRKVCQQMKH